MSDVELRFPIGGISDDRALDSQEVLTTRDALNVRSVDPTSGRMRGGRRPGLSRYLEAALNGSVKVADLATTVYDRPRLTYAANAMPEAEWQVAGRAAESVADIQIDRQGNRYILDGPSAVTKFNAAGELLYTINVPVPDAGHFCRTLLVDSLDVIYVGVADGGAQATAQVYAFRQLEDNRAELLWTIAPDPLGVSGTPGPGAYIERLRIQTADDHLYLALNDRSSSRSWVEVYGALDGDEPTFLWRAEIQFPVNDMDVSLYGDIFIASSPPAAPDSSVLVKYQANTGTEVWRLTTAETRGIGYGVRVDGSGNIFSVGPDLISSAVHTVKVIDLIESPSLRASDGSWSAAWPSNQGPEYEFPRLDVDSFGNVYVPLATLSLDVIGGVWAAEGDDLGVGVLLYTVAPNRVDGQRGYAIAVDPFTPEYTKQAATSPARAETLAVGTSVAGSLATGQVTFTDPTLPVNGSTLVIDDGLNPAITYEYQSAGAAAPGNIRFLGLSFVVMMASLHSEIEGQFNLGNSRVDPGAFTAQTAAGILGLTNTRSSLSSNVPLVASGSPALNATVSGMDGASPRGRQLTLHSYNVLTVTEVAESPRAQVAVGVADGDVVKFETTGTTAVTNLAPRSLNSAAPYIHSTSGQGRIYFADGSDYFVYQGRTNELSLFRETGAGRFQTRCKILEIWRDRLVGVSDPNDPQNWHMSAQGDHFDWNQFPSRGDEALATQAISGNNALAGKNPDIVTAFIPYNDDLAFFGGDHTLHRMTGDPMAGGQIDLVSDVTGVAFGRAWCKDPQGFLYFVGSRGDFYSMGPGGVPERQSRDRISRRMQAIDLSLYYARCVYDHESTGVWIFYMPYGAGGAVVDSFYFDIKTSKLSQRPVFWRDQFVSKDGAALNADRQPTSAITLDGDEPADRVMLIGCNDGRVRKVDRDAADDDGLSVKSHVLIGPFQSGDSHSETRITALTVTLARDLGGAFYRVYVTDTAELTGEPVRQGRLGPGRNQRISVRATGAYVWLWLGSAETNATWSLENAQVRMERGGRRRVRR